jgi:hypothetical protein
MNIDNIQTDLDGSRGNCVCTREDFVQISVGTATVLIEYFRGIPQSVYANSSREP